MTDAEYDLMDALEDQALARLRDADAWSEEETDEDDSLEYADISFGHSPREALNKTRTPPPLRLLHQRLRRIAQQPLVRREVHGAIESGDRQELEGHLRALSDPDDAATKENAPPSRAAASAGAWP